MANKTYNLSLAKSVYLNKNYPDTNYPTNTSTKYQLIYLNGFLLFGYGAFPTSLKRKKLVNVRFVLCAKGKYDYSNIYFNAAPDFATSWTYNQYKKAIDAGFSGGNIANITDAGSGSSTVNPPTADYWTTLGTYDAQTWSERAALFLKTRCVLIGDHGSDWSGASEPFRCYAYTALTDWSTPLAQITYDDAVNITSKPEITTKFPDYVKVNETATIKWKLVKNSTYYCANETWTQASAKLYYKKTSASSWSTKTISGSTMSYTMPANTFEEGVEYQYYLQTTDTDGTTATTDTFTLTGAESTIKPNSYPSGTIDPRNNITFSWTFYSRHTSNYLQKSASLYYKVEGAASWTKVDASGTTQGVIIPANTFPTGKSVSWYLSGVDSAGHASTSSTYSFSTITTQVTMSSYPSGDTDNRQQITFSWYFATGTARDYAQKSAKLYWKKSTDSSYNSISASGATTSLKTPAYTFPTGATIDWYVSGTDAGGYTSTTEVQQFKVPNASIATTTSPTGNAIDPRVALTFAWKIAGALGDYTQKSAVFYWRKSGAANYTSINISNSTKSVAVPANTFPAGSTIQWYVSATDSSGTSYATNAATFTTVSPKITATAYPSGTVNTRNVITFAWKFSSAAGDFAQTSAKLYWRVSGATNYNQIAASGATTSVSVPSLTFPTGSTIQWYLEGTAAGVTSSTNALTFTTVSPKITPVTYPSGNDVYTGAAIKFTWDFVATGGNYNQRSATFYWRANTTDNYTAVPASGTTRSVTIPANTFPTNKTIQWYLSGTDESGYSSTSSVSSFTTNKTQITPQSSPTSGYINPRTAQKFQWYFKATGGAVPQGSATFYWRVKGASSWTSIAASGTTTSVTVPSNTFPVASYIEWYVAGTDTGGYSSTSDTYELSTTAEMAYAYPQSPVNGMIDGSQPATFTWIAETADGAPINSIHLRYRAAGAQAWTTLGFLGTDRSYTFPADTFDPGIIEWQTNATNIDVIDGPWAGATFICMIAPKVTGLNATAVPWSTIRWQANDQQCYQIEIDGTVSGPYFGTEREFTLPDYLRDGVHTIRLRVKGSMDLWSTWAETTVAIENVPETALTLTAEADTDTELAWETASATEDFYVYRDDKMIAHTRNKAFVDRLALGRHEYHVVNRLASGHYDRSETAVTTTHVQHLSLAGIDGGEWAQIVHTLKSAKDPEIKETMSVSYTHFAGRARPDAVASEFIDTPIVCSAVFLPNEQQALRTMRGLFGKTVIVKMIDGSCRVCFLDSWTYHDRKHYYTAFTFTLQQIEWEDFIDDTA